MRIIMALQAQTLVHTHNFIYVCMYVSIYTLRFIVFMLHAHCKYVSIDIIAPFSITASVHRHEHIRVILKFEKKT